jgi:hypothetical protein
MWGKLHFEQEETFFLSRSFFVGRDRLLFWVWIIGLVVVIMVAAICFSFIRGEIHYTREQNKGQLDIEIKAIFGVRIFRYFVPVIKTKLSEKTKDKILDLFHMTKMLMQNTSHLYGWLKSMLLRVECTELIWITRVGVGDASQTAIVAGAVWGVKSSLLGFIMHFVQMKSKPRVDVVPQYNQPQFSTQFTGAARIRVIFVLWAGISLLLHIIKIKGGLRTWFRVFVKPKAKVFT